jgi:hypothetical protein
MTPREFVYWLRGFFEIADAGKETAEDAGKRWLPIPLRLSADDGGLSAAQVKKIRWRLDAVMSQDKERPGARDDIHEFCFRLHGGLIYHSGGEGLPKPVADQIRYRLDILFNHRMDLPLAGRPDQDPQPLTVIRR